MTNSRLIAIGDIHGHAAALSALVRLFEPRPDDTVVTLGDYVDRGPDSKGVLDQLLELRDRCQLACLLGNHEEMMLAARQGRSELDRWLACGGEVAIRCYGRTADLSGIPQRHWAFVESMPLVFETERYFFVHANYFPNRKVAEQDTQTALWTPLDNGALPSPHYSGKVAILGHTPQPDGRILDLKYLKCIDTGCGSGGWLTALDVLNGNVFQVDQSGTLRC